MIKKWVKLLPYWLVMKLVRDFNGSYGTLNKYKVRYFQIDEGEFVVFSEELQEIFDKRKREKAKEKTNKKLERINKQLSKDYSLKEEFKRQIEGELEEEQEEARERMGE